MPDEDKRFKNMLESSPDWFWEFDEQANFTYVSPRIRDLLGYEPDELIGVNAFSLMTAEEAERVHKHFDPIAKTYLPFSNLINTNIHKDGHEVIIESSGTPIFDEAGQFRGYRGIDRDITERKRTEDALIESTDRLISLAENVPGHVAYVDANTLQYQYVNGAFEKSFGLPTDKIIGSHVQELLGEKNYQYALPYIEAVRSGKSVSYENTFSLTSGTRWIQVNYNPVFDTNGQVTSIAVLSYDITDRKNTEIRLKESNKELDMFVRAIAHDLRTPVTPIIGYVEMLRAKYHEKFDNQALTFLAEIERAGKEILTFIESLLSLAQTGEMKRSAELVSTDEVVMGVIKNLATNLSRAGVDMQVNSLPAVHVPKTFLSQIFDNLIGNAIRYAGHRGSVIEVGGEQNGPHVRFFVRDHGPGIPEEERKHIFEIFYRGKNSGEVQGTGVGLAIVGKIARNCGGRTWVEETPGGGCTFWVELEDAAEA